MKVSASRYSFFRFSLFFFFNSPLNCEQDTPVNGNLTNGSNNETT